MESHEAKAMEQEALAALDPEVQERFANLLARMRERVADTNSGILEMATLTIYDLALLCSTLVGRPPSAVLKDMTIKLAETEAEVFISKLMEASDQDNGIIAIIQQFEGGEHDHA